MHDEQFDTAVFTAQYYKVSGRKCIVLFLEHDLILMIDGILIGHHKNYNIGKRRRRSCYQNSYY